MSHAANPVRDISPRPFRLLQPYALRDGAGWPAPGRRATRNGSAYLKLSINMPVTSRVTGRPGPGSRPVTTASAIRTERPRPASCPATRPVPPRCARPGAESAAVRSAASWPAGAGEPRTRPRRGPDGPSRARSAVPGAAGRAPRPRRPAPRRPPGPPAAAPAWPAAPSAPRPTRPAPRPARPPPPHRTRQRTRGRPAPPAAPAPASRQRPRSRPPATCRGDDGWLAVEIEDAADWQVLARLVGRDDLASFVASDAGAAGALGAALASWAAERTAQQAMRVLQRAGLAAGAVQDAEDAVRDPQHRERHFWLEMDHPDLGVAEYAAPPHRLAKTPPTVRRPTPRLGAHTVEVLGEWLGMTPDEAAPYVWPRPS